MRKLISLRTVLIWLFCVFAVVAIFRLDKQSRSPERITASDFLSAIEHGEVSDVVLQGGEVLGKRDGKPVQTYTAHHEPFITALIKHHIPYDEKEAESALWIYILINLLPVIFIFALLFFMMRDPLKGSMKSIQKNYTSVVQKVNTRFSDVAGIDEAVHEVQTLVSFLKNPAQFSKVGARFPRGVLLEGPSGTGKTLLARALAGEAGVPFIPCSASEFVEMFVGVGAKRVRELFEKARQNSPCIVFIDEIDAVGKKRAGTVMGSGGHDEREQTLNQILIEMDGFAENKGTIVLAATNRADVLDSALLRAGRFDRKVVVPKPDIKGREAILRVHTQNKKLSSEVDLSVIARGTFGMVGADLENLVNEAAIIAALAGHESISHNDFEEAREKIIMGSPRKSAVISKEEKRVTAYHEAGHAIVGYFTPACDDVHRVTIVPHGGALGVTITLPSDENNIVRHSKMVAHIDMLYGGRVAEELIFGEPSTGAQNDFARLTAIANSMIKQYAMGFEVSKIRVFEDNENEFFGHTRSYSDEMANILDSQVTTLLQKRYDAVLSLLNERKELLVKLAEELLVKETLRADDLAQILGPKPIS